MACVTGISLSETHTENECADPTSGAAVSYTLTAIVTPAGASAAGYQWDFGDGTTTTTPGPTALHPYTTPGAHDVIVTALAGPGCSDVTSAPLTIVVAACAPIVCPTGVSVTAAFLGGCAPAPGADYSFTAVVAPGTPPPGTTYTWNFSDGGSGSGSPVSHPFFASGLQTATVLVQPAAGSGCGPVAGSAAVVVPACACPAIVDLAATIDGCAGGGASATVSFLGAISPPAPGCSIHWDFGDGSPDVVTTTPSTTHTYATPGTYSVAAALICGTCVDMATLTVIVDPCCATVTGLSGTIDCVDGTARGTFLAATDPPSAPGTYTWTFGPGIPPRSTSVATVTQEFPGPGTRTVQVTFAPEAPECEEPSVASITVTIPACEGDGGDGGDGGDETLGCLIGRWSVLILFTLSTLFFLLYACLLHLPVILGLAIGFAIAAALAFALWLIFCGSACGAMLLAWQIPLAAGAVVAYMSGCCGTLYVFVAVGLLLTSIALFLVWMAACDPAACVALRELAVAIDVAAGTVIASVASLTSCGVAWYAILLAVLGGILTSAALACYSTAGPDVTARMVPGRRRRRRGCC